MVLSLGSVLNTGRRKRRSCAEDAEKKEEDKKEKMKTSNF
jgi:hypothetical protein